MAFVLTSSGAFPNNHITYLILVTCSKVYVECIYAHLSLEY